jgi:hypothetical protein
VLSEVAGRLGGVPFKARLHALMLLHFRSFILTPLTSSPLCGVVHMASCNVAPGTVFTNRANTDRGKDDIPRIFGLCAEAKRAVSRGMTA